MNTIKDKTVVLISCENVIFAHIVQNVLDEFSIPSMIQNDISASVALQGLMGIQILVFEKDLDKAKKILKDRKIKR